VNGAPVDGVPVDGVPVDGIPVDGVPVGCVAVYFEVIYALYSKHPQIDNNNTKRKNMNLFMFLAKHTDLCTGFDG